MTLASLHPHKRDARIHFDAVNHVYTLLPAKKEEIPYTFTRSITKLVSHFFPGFCAKQALRGVEKWKKDPNSKYYGLLHALSHEFPLSATLNREDLIIAEIWKTKGLRAASMGTCLHASIELHLELEAAEKDRCILASPSPPIPKNIEEEKVITTTAEKDPPPTHHHLTLTALQSYPHELCDEDAKAILYFVIHNAIYHQHGGRGGSAPLENEMLAWKQWRSTRLHLEPLRVEWSIYSTRFKIAGQLDALFRNALTNEIYLYDWKRTADDLSPAAKAFGNRKALGPFKGILIDTSRDHYTLQLNLYAIILKQCYGIQVQKLVLVQIHSKLPPPHYQEHEVPFLPDDLLEQALLWPQP